MSERDAFYKMLRELTGFMDAIIDGMVEIREAVENLGEIFYS